MLSVDGRDSSLDSRALVVVAARWTEAGSSSGGTGVAPLRAPQDDACSVLHSALLKQDCALRLLLLAHTPRAVQ
jgi:hypothetical protein